MSLVAWLATANQPVGIESPLSDLESDLPAGDPTEVVQQHAQAISQAVDIQPARLLKVLTILLHWQQ